MLVTCHFFIVGAFAARLLVEMKTFGIVLLVLAAAGYYFGVDFSELFPTVPKSEAARERVSHAPAAPEQKSSAAPRPSAVARNQDGSLADRWKP